MAFLFGVPFMFTAMAVGITVNTAFDTGSDVSNSCDDLNKAKDAFNDVKKKYEALIKDAFATQINIDNYKISLATHRDTMKSLTKTAKKAFQVKRTAQIISFSVFIWVLVMTLLFKYFKIFDLVLGIFFGKK